jgi:xylulose-5-phosphate/fructose-6-phosphate phosphoketolase
VINLIVASKHPLPQYLSIDEAKEHVARGASVWDWASNDNGEPDIVLAACGEIPTVELLAAASLLREHVPELRTRFVNVNDLYALASSAHHPSGLSQAEFTEIFTKDRPVLFNFHGYPSAIHQLIHRRPSQARFHVRGYMEEGTTTTPFDLLAMNGVDRYQLAIEALTRADILAAEMLPSMSGEFAVRAVPDAEAAINKFRAKLEQLRSTIREVGDDPAEIKEWVWSTNGHGPITESGAM